MTTALTVTKSNQKPQHQPIKVLA